MPSQDSPLTDTESSARIQAVLDIKHTMGDIAESCSGKLGQKIFLEPFSSIFKITKGTNNHLQRNIFMKIKICFMREAAFWNFIKGISIYIIES